MLSIVPVIVIAAAIYARFVRKIAKRYQDLLAEVYTSYQDLPAEGCTSYQDFTCRGVYWLPGACYPTV